ncbi:ABC transporter ATP-binding protein [Cellulomonas carbonis]|uniref:Spermidine/putrescine ABC transporter ATP-binding protein n=1 Tax=Cellulomonas carbonis T26 TaxID=947969 RepID=A0A0A0BV44_9CELL|nr:ABC transporter ATP-binding protein [Cellulomonas carbonis]KGM12228.1 spermidine/putrescine ABC transporter ATP-binding protein [Cellulomonas carbonis T26]
MPTSPDAVRVDGLVKRYGRVEAVRGLDLVARPGAVTAVLGPNGAGKTTTVECCEGLRSPDGGTVRVLGLDPVADARALRPRVGVMLQDGGLPSTVPAGEVLRHVASMYARPRPLDELGDRLGLGSFARTQVRRLSGGQRQRLALAAAVVGRPEVAFLDEPSAGLDPQSRIAVWDLVRELRDDGTAIVLTTHQMAEAEQLADHVVVVDGGRAVAAGTPGGLVGGAGQTTAGTLRLTVVPVRAPADTRPAAATWAGALGASLERAGVVARVDADPRRADALEVHAQVDPGLVRLVTAWADDTGLLVTSLAAGPRTLEDVFLELTGRSLR